MKDDDPSVRVLYFFDVHPPSQNREDSLPNLLYVVERRTPHHAPGMGVRDAEHEPPAAFVREGDAVVEQGLKSERAPRFLELEVFVLEGELKPPFQFRN